MALNSTSDNNSEFSLNSVELMDVLITQALGTGNRTLHYINRHTYDILIRVAQEEIQNKVANIRKQSASYPHSREALRMVLHRINTFAQEQNEQYHLMRFKSVIYQLELAYKLSRIDYDNHEITAFSPVDELLIYMNYNSKRYIRMLQEWLSERIDKDQAPVEQLQTMQFYEKAFSQIQQKPEVALHDDYVPIKSVLANWFEHEIKYLENQAELWLKTKEVQPNTENTAVEPKDRIGWNASGDQIALLLRAAHDTGLIDAKSKRQAFEMVIQYVKTPYRDSLSPSATRSCAYQAEQVDKDIVINFLHKMSKRIEEY